MELNGCCEFCGQHKMIDVPDPNMTQAEVDALVTDNCDCVQAKSERRKKALEEKINSFIESEVDPEARDFMRAAVEMIRTYQCDTVCIKTNTGWNITAKLHKDAEIVFSCKKSLSKKAVF